MTIWRLVEQCAKELTANGVSPFTRQDIIRCIQRKDASIGKDSINPIIQGLTDNLRGGAPGTVGKNILHSVDRGLFVLRENNPINNALPKRQAPNQFQKSSISHKKKISRIENLMNQLTSHEIKRIGSYDFIFICNIEPEREPNGVIKSFMPQTRYENSSGIPLNRYGKGPFCKFKIPRNLDYPGVYVLIENDENKYIGECIGLSSRYNMGYGNISPRNCFVGGQETNCRINNLILQRISAGSEISLWFHVTCNFKQKESELRALLLPSWNRV